MTDRGSKARGFLVRSLHASLFSVFSDLKQLKNRLIFVRRRRRMTDVLFLRGGLLESSIITRFQLLFQALTKNCGILRRTQALHSEMKKKFFLKETLKFSLRSQNGRVTQRH